MAGAWRVWEGEEICRMERPGNSPLVLPPDPQTFMIGTGVFCKGRDSECMEMQIVMGHQGPGSFYPPQAPSHRPWVLPGLGMYAADT